MIDTTSADSLGELPAPPKTKRHERCTGNALATALALLEVSVPRSGEPLSVQRP